MRGSIWTRGTLLLAFGVGTVAAASAVGEFKLLASDGAAQDRFGSSVSLSGDRAVVGASLSDDDGDRSGSAYVFEEVGGAWVEMAKLTASDGDVDAQFGSSTAIVGDTVIVGAHGDDENGVGAGAAYVFENVGGVWSEMQKLTPTDGSFSDSFGWSTSISGDTAVISAIGGATGAAYIFENVGGIWIETAKLTPSDSPVCCTRFGQSASISGDTVVVGRMFDSPSGTSSGSAYVFERAGGIWAETAKLVPADGEAFDNFGISVSVSGSTVVVGALRDDGFTGSAYVFREVGGVWIEAQKLTASDRAAGDLFGRAVAVIGSRALIGADGADGNSPFGDGAAYVFEEVGGVWSEAGKLFAPGGAPIDHFGESVSLSSNLALIGATGDDDNGSASGSAWVLELSDPVIVVAIEVNPGTGTNTVNLGSKGVVPLVILTTDTFDATTVDGTTVRFGPGEASEAHSNKPMGHFADADGDGDTDLVFHFRTQATGIACGDTSAALTGELLDGTPIQGEAAIETVGC